MFTQPRLQLTDDYISGGFDERASCLAANGRNPHERDEPAVRAGPTRQRIISSLEWRATSPYHRGLLRALTLDREEREIKDMLLRTSSLVGVALADTVEV